VIGGQDTGYDWQHPALINQYRGWNGTAADHNYNWHDAIHENNPKTPPGNDCGFDSPQPCDDHGHGTHTMGTMVGDDGGNNQIGMAPDAQWIGCRNMEQGWGAPATYAECYEWFVAPYPEGGNSMVDGVPAKAPHVINNSWSCPVSEGCTDPDILKDVVENVRAAGIVTVHSAGNSGPSCSTVHEPAAIYDASFSVAATYYDEQIASDVIAGFSSRGPVTKGDNNPAKPDISAPGVGIQSSLRGGSYGFMSGTSMAAPHVAGLVGLLVAAQPGLVGNVDALEQAIMESAVPLYTSQGCGGDEPDSLPNHVYGWGRIDAKKAHEAVGGTAERYISFMPILMDR
jgi:subtilisin family serine protease